MAIDFSHYDLRGVRQAGRVRPAPATPASLRGQTLSALKGRLEASLDRCGLMGGGFAARVRTVTLVASCSRSGSSYFMELLQKSPRFLQCCGEINPFLQVTGRAWPEIAHDSDWLDADDCAADCTDLMAAYLAGEVGVIDDAMPSAPDEFFIERLYRRLHLQWPLERFDLGAIRRAASKAVGVVAAERGRPCDWSQDTELFHLAFLSVMRRHHPAINPYYYDMDRKLVERFLPDLAVPVGPPSPVIIEEPPFVLIRPMRAWTDRDLETRPLLIKTPSNVYRIGFLQRLFENADIRVLHLKRNPAAAMNGLLDGWRYCGFHSHYVGNGLLIPGYSERGAPDQGWWKFDLPPGWRSLQRSSLEEICAHQWVTAQEAILTDLDRPEFAYHPVCFEDVLQEFQANPGELTALRSWLGDDGFLGAHGRVVRPVMSTAPPRPRRWLDRAAQLRPLLDRGDIRAMAGALGYKDEAKWL